MSRASDLSLTLPTAEAYDPHTIEINGASMVCSSGSESRETVFDVGGADIVASVTVFARKSLMPARTVSDLASLTVDSTTHTADDSTQQPRSGMRVRYDFRDYRILRVRDLGSAFQIHLMDPNSNR